MCSDKYVPIHNHSAFSLLDGLPSPAKIVERAKEIGSPAVGITDHGNICGMIDFYKACKKHSIKPIQGVELYICQQDPSIRTSENKTHNHLTVLAKNQDGISDLISLVSATNNPEWFYRKPRIDLENLKPFAKKGNLICLSGCIIGELSASLFEDVGNACLVGEQTNSVAEVRKLLKTDWKEITERIALKYQNIFGKENFFIELQEEGMPAQIVTVECLRQLSEALNIPSVASLDAHYARREDCDDHRILLYSQLRTTQEQQENIKKNGGDTMSFFFRDTFYIFSPEEMKQHYKQSEIEMSLQIADMVKPYSVGSKPKLPKFINNEEDSSDQHLRDLCIQGESIKLADKTPSEILLYRARLEKELKVIKEANLADYFLAVWDVCKYVDDNNGPRGKGRGSGAGCLVNHLLNITDIDPIEYDLYFERFYNMSRNIPPHFDVGYLTFMDWLVKFYENNDQRTPEESRERILNFIKKKDINNDAYKKKIDSEIEWIDKNNDKMWIYLADLFREDFVNNKDLSVFDNKANSAIVKACTKNSGLDVAQKLIKHDGHISLPDIDIDISIDFREKVLNYLYEKWGNDFVAPIITFGRLQGKAALKEVFRAQPDMVKKLAIDQMKKEGKPINDEEISPFDICNAITSYIPNESSISDELQQARQERDQPDYGILQWSVENIDKVYEAYQIYKPLFDQAQRIEGTKKSQSKHPAGIIICKEKIQDIVPMTYDTRSKSRIVGLEMANAEALGMVKFDFLGVAALDKIKMAQNLINGTQAEEVLDEDFKEEE